MRVLLLIALALLPPAAPQVTVGSNLLKVLQFDWLPVPEATHYQLHFKPDAASPFAPLGGPILAPRVRANLTIPVHGLDWVNARYKVSACNADGCQDSAEIPVQDLMLTSIGYFKSADPDVFDGFGATVVLSQDGNTLLTSMHDDSESAANPRNNGVQESGAAYVFRRIGASWRRVAFLKALHPQEEQYFGIGYPVGGRALAVSANGQVIAVGAPREIVNGVEGAGAVYLFTRDEAGNFSFANDGLRPPVPQVFDFFGLSVDLNSEGTLLKVTSMTPYDDDGYATGTTHLYQHTDAGWVFLSSFGAEPNDDFCGSTMSANAQAIVAVCFNTVTGAMIRARRRQGQSWVPVQNIALPSIIAQQPAVSGNAARMAALTTNSAGVRLVKVYAWTGSRWIFETQFASPGGTATDYPSWGVALEFNHDGTMLAIADYTNSSGGAGVMNSRLPPTTPPPFRQEGAVFVYRRDAARWTLSRVVKAPYPQHADLFGRDVALSGNGMTMAIGASAEDSASPGIDGNQADNSKQSAGAVYLY